MLQSRDSVLLLFHIVAVIHYFFAEYYHIHFIKLPDHGPYKIFHTHGGRFKFLTVWNMVFQAFFFWVCLLNDIFGTNEIKPNRAPFIRKFRDFIHTSIGVPLSLFVASSFWSIWFYDRELVFPKALDVHFPMWLNHSMHTLILFFTFTQTYLCYHVYPKRVTGLTTLLALVFCYLSGIFSVYLGSGMWVYPIFEVLSWSERVGFLTMAVSHLLIMYLVGDFVNNLIWGEFDLGPIE